MTVTFFCRLAADFSLFYAFANCVLLFVVPDLSATFWMPVVLLLVAGLLSFGLKMKTGLKPIVAAPLFLPFLVLILLPGWPSLLVTIPPWAYLLYILYLDLELLSYSECHERFLMGLKLLPLLLLPLLFSLKPTLLRIFQTHVLPFVLFYLFCSVLSLRLNRYQADALRKPTTQWANFLLLALLVLGCLVVVYANVWALVGETVALIYRFVLAPILLLLALVITVPFFALGELLKLMAGEPRTEDELFQVELGEFIDTGLETYTALEIPVFLRYALLFLLAVGVLYLVWRFFRRLAARSTRIAPVEAVVERRQKLATGPSRDIDLFPPSDPRNAIRYHYRRFLRLCRKYGLPVGPNQTSRDVGVSAAGLLRSKGLQGEAQAALDEFQELYLPARYNDSGQATFGKGDADKAKDDYHKIVRALK